jgi:hypothetical protein
MTAPGNDFLFLVLTLSILLSSAYAVGRIHQWHKHGVERDEAYRLGYDKASLSILNAMSRQCPAGGTPVGAGLPVNRSYPSIRPRRQHSREEFHRARI